MLVNPTGSPPRVDCYPLATFPGAYVPQPGGTARVDGRIVGSETALRPERGDPAARARPLRRAISHATSSRTPAAGTATPAVTSTDVP